MCSMHLPSSLAANPDKDIRNDQSASSSDYADERLPGVLTIRLIALSLTRLKGVWNVPSPFCRQDASSAQSAFQQSAHRKQTRQLRRRIWTTISAILRPNENLGLSSETRSHQAGLVVETLAQRSPRGEPISVRPTPSCDVLCGVQDRLNEVQRLSLRKTGIGGP